MKIKDGKIKLSKDDTQLGNFILTKEENHVKIMTVSGVWSIRYHNSTTKAKFLLDGLKLGMTEKIEGVIMMVYCISTCIPDVKFLEDCLRIYNERVERDKELITQEEHDRILQEEKEFYMSQQVLKNE